MEAEGPARRRRPDASSRERCEWNGWTTWGSMWRAGETRMIQPIANPVSVGMATAAMILNGLDFRYRQWYVVPQSVENTPVEHVFGQGSCSPMSVWDARWIGSPPTTPRRCVREERIKHARSSTCKQSSSMWTPPPSSCVGKMRAKGDKREQERQECGKRPPIPHASPSHTALHVSTVRISHKGCWHLPPLLRGISRSFSSRGTATAAIQEP